MGRSEAFAMTVMMYIVERGSTPALFCLCLYIITQAKNSGGRYVMERVFVIKDRR